MQEDEDFSVKKCWMISNLMDETMLAFILYRAGLGVYASKDEDDTG